MPWWLAGIGALLAGTGGLVDSIIETKRTKKDAEDQLADLIKSYGLKTEEAELEYKKAKEEAGRNADEADVKAAQTEKQAAQEDLQADLKDAEQDVTERIVSGDFNTAIDNLYLSQKADAYNWNDALAQMGSSEGSAYATLAGSGIRAGSSLSDAVMLDKASNSAQLQFAQESKRQSDNNSLYSVLNNLAGSRFNIMQNRYGADFMRENAGFMRENAALMRDDAAYLRNSYEEGGSNWNIYKKNLEIMEQNYKYNKDVLNKTIQRNSFDKNGNGQAWFNAIGSFLTMGARGFSGGYDLGSTIALNSGYNPDKYTTKVKSKE